jgi:hypothetical protein
LVRNKLLANSPGPQIIDRNLSSSTGFKVKLNMHQAWSEDAEDCGRTYPPQGKTTLPFFFLGVMFSLVLFSHRCNSSQLVHCKLAMFCTTFTALRLPSVFNSSIL